MSTIDDIREVLRLMSMSPQDIDSWLATPNKGFGGQSPQAMIDEGKANIVYSTLICLAQGNVS